ncbi:MAG: hypothetical protein IPN17_22560 [Deltaproteobacteria bacterium]|nr:hypothetical protein [Deltaproteobacteria bacterium]
MSFAYGVQVERPLIVMHTWGSGAPPNGSHAPAAPCVATVPVVTVSTHREDGSMSQVPAPPHWNPRPQPGAQVPPQPSGPHVRPEQLGVQTH